MGGPKEGKGFEFGVEIYTYSFHHPLSVSPPWFSEDRPSCVDRVVPLTYSYRLRVGNGRTGVPRQTSLSGPINSDNM